MGEARFEGNKTIRLNGLYIPRDNLQRSTEQVIYLMHGPRWVPIVVLRERLPIQQGALAG